MIFFFKLFRNSPIQNFDGRPSGSALGSKKKYNPFQSPSRGHFERFQLLPGDYFHRYDLELAKKAEKVSIIATGGSGTVVLVSPH